MIGGERRDPVLTMIEAERMADFMQERGVGVCAHERRVVVVVVGPDVAALLGR